MSFDDKGKRAKAVLLSEKMEGEINYLGLSRWGDGGVASDNLAPASDVL